MGNKVFLSGNEAAAFGVKLAGPKVIAAYPITPQTTLVEKLSEFIADGDLDCKYMLVDSEHSAMAATLGASMMGVRAFTASSSQGLLYMAEMLHYVSGARHPVVMVDANRALATPWSIFGDQRDVLSQRDAGWIMLFCESGQDALDTVIQAFKVAEDPEVMIPVMVNLDGFTLTHTYDVCEVPEQADVDKYLPPLNTNNKFDMNEPKGLCISYGPDIHMESRVLQEEAFERSKAVIEKAAADYEKAFGRNHGGLIQEYKCDDAEVVIVGLGSMVGTTRMVVDQLRAEGKKVGLIKLRSYRPFPVEYFASIADKYKAIGVMERDISFGIEGAVFSEVRSAMCGLTKTPMINFVAGLGGRDISKDNIVSAYEKLFNIASGKVEEKVQFLGARW